MQTKQYPVGNPNLVELASELEQFFKVQGHQTQSFPVGNGYLVQAQKESTLSNILGQSSALTVKIVSDVNLTIVEIGSSKWMDKAAVGVIGFVIMPVLAIIPMIGAYNQYKLAEDAWKIVDSFMARQLHNSYTPHAWKGSKSCPHCNASIKADAVFCSACGDRVASTVNALCTTCGKVNEPGARFCSACGNRFEL